MLNQMLHMFITVIFPKTHLEKYLSSCTQIEFERRLVVRMQRDDRIFAPYYYKDPLIRDCILELKERNSADAARLLGHRVAQWIAHVSERITDREVGALLYIVPVPQHCSKTRDKGFAHTHTLADEIRKIIPARIRAEVFPCVEKAVRTKRLHDLSGKRLRFKTIKGTMRAHITSADAGRAYFFIIDDVYTSGATFK